jgi:hypothetical protein
MHIVISTDSALVLKPLNSMGLTPQIGGLRCTIGSFDQWPSFPSATLQTKEFSASHHPGSIESPVWQKQLGHYYCMCLQKKQKHMPKEDLPGDAMALLVFNPAMDDVEVVDLLSLSLIFSPQRPFSGLPSILKRMFLKKRGKKRKPNV